MTGNDNEQERTQAAREHLQSLTPGTNVVLVDRRSGHRLTGQITKTLSGSAGLIMTGRDMIPYTITVTDLLDGKYRIATQADADAGLWRLFDPYGYTPPGQQ